jgi:hypothetical protein
MTPRRSRRDPPEPRGRRERPVTPAESIAERVLGPRWARVEGYEVRETVQAAKRYRCPYCEGWIEPGTPHLVAFPAGRSEERRHYHSACWAKQAQRRRA